jgi:hypothetical protein
MPSGLFATPRPTPARLVPAMAGTAAIVVALPVFVVAGLPLEAWGIAATLWLAYPTIGLALERVRLGGDSLVAAGIVAVGRISRAVLLAGVLIAVAVSDSTIGLPAAIVYGIAFSLEFVFSVLAYMDGEATYMDGEAK